jgi:aldose 1-epimerase
MGVNSFGVRREHFGTLPDGMDAQKITLTQEGVDALSGHTAVFTNFGGRWLSFTGPDRHGELADIIRGPETLEECLADKDYAGAIIGRYANRLEGATFELDGVRHHLTANDRGNTLHGGISGFDCCCWQVGEMVQQEDCAFVELIHRSPDGDQGFPGNLEVRARYTLREGGQLHLDLVATTDRATVISLTCHPYFNLHGRRMKESDNSLGHLLQLPAARFLPIAADAVPTGNPLPVGHTPFDFRSPSVIGSRMDWPDEQLEAGRGYDHYFPLEGASPTAIAPPLHAVLHEPTRGRQLKVYSTLPGLQFYSGNFLAGASRLGSSDGNSVGAYRPAVCLEPQFPPNAPNRQDFPSTKLVAGLEWRHSIVYELGVA